MISFQNQIRELEAIGNAVDKRLAALQIQSDTVEQQYAQELAQRAARVRNLTATPADLELDSISVGGQLAEYRDRFCTVAQAAVELSTLRIRLSEIDPNLAQQAIAPALESSRRIAEIKAGITQAELLEIARQSTATGMWKQLALSFFDFCESVASIARYYLKEKTTHSREEHEDLNKLTEAIALASTDLTQGLRTTRELAGVLAAKYPASHELNKIAEKNLRLLTDHATIRAARSAHLN